MNTAYDRESLESLACFFECYLKRSLFFLGCVLCLLIIMTGLMLKLKIEQHCGGISGLKGYAKPVRKSGKQSQDIGYRTSQSKITGSENISELNNHNDPLRFESRSQYDDITKKEITESQNISHLENNKNLLKEQEIKSKYQRHDIDISEKYITDGQNISNRKNNENSLNFEQETKYKNQSHDIDISRKNITGFTGSQYISDRKNNENSQKFEQDIKYKNDGQVVDILKPNTTGSEHTSEQKYGKQKDDWDVNAGEARSTTNTDKPCGIVHQFLKCVKEGFANPSSSTSDASQEQNEQQKEGIPPHKQYNTYKNNNR